MYLAVNLVNGHLILN